MYKKISYFILVTLVIFSVSSCIFAQNFEVNEPVTLTWVAGGVGGGWYTQAGGIAELITKKEPKISIKVIPGGGVTNPIRVDSGDADLGWGVNFVDKMALEGRAPLFEKSYNNVRTIGGVFNRGVYHFIAAKEVGIKSVEELAKMIKDGKAINVAAPMKGTSELPGVEAIFKFYGISFEDIEQNGGKVFHAVYGDMASLFQDRHVDFAFTNIAAPAAAVIEMQASRNLTILSVSSDCIEHCHNELGTMSIDSDQSILEAGTYDGQDEEIPIVAQASELLINKDIPDNLAYTITKIMCENVDELYKIEKENQRFIPEEGWKNVVFPVHSGSEIYYREAGYMK